MFKVPAYLTRFSTRADGGIGLSFVTQEMPSQDLAELHKHLNTFGWILYSPYETVQPTIEDVPKQVLEDGQKTPSQRLRAVMFLVWDKTDKSIDFNTFYTKQMDKLIEHYKTKLE